MPPLPTLRSQEVVRTFERLGWTVARQRGSHIIMARDGSIATLSIPAHKEVAKGTLRSLIRSAELTVQEFLAACEDTH
ncbi:MAG TPA: type II toxin-antitoxin system HicA family toxin [Candidatus Bathyarchaeia archaeon]|nr:type II toxin-antitoxin system HicA family toxin [Candidatus Bathyarchaeia archaeon]